MSFYVVCSRRFAGGISADISTSLYLYGFMYVVTLYVNTVERISYRFSVFLKVRMGESFYFS